MLFCMARCKNRQIKKSDSIEDLAISEPQELWIRTHKIQPIDIVNRSPIVIPLMSASI